MKQIAIFIFFITTLSAISQISITKNDLPNAGESFTYSNASTNGLKFNAKKTGSHQTWDFSTLKPSSQGVYNYVSSLSTPYLAYFFNTIGIKTQDTLNLILVKLSNIHDFYKKTDTKFSIVGRGFSLEGLPLPANYEIEDKIYNFPLKYEDKDSTPFYFKLTDPTGSLPIGYAQTGWRVTKVDGWGNITTPYGSFDCIRVKTKLITTDTITIAGFSIPIRRTSFEYRWLTNGEKIPILQINGNETGGTFTATEVKYRDVPRELKPIADFTYTDTKGEPGYEITFSDLSKNNPTEWIWSVEPSTVSYMWGTNPGSQSVNIRFDSLGQYDISLRASNKGGFNDKIRKGLVTISMPNTTTGMSELSDIHFRMYPNPAQDKIYINFITQNTVHRSITIYSMDGREKITQSISENQTQIDISKLQAGTYAIKIQEGDDINYRLLVKE